MISRPLTRRRTGFIGACPTRTYLTNPDGQRVESRFKAKLEAFADEEAQETSSEDDQVAPQPAHVSSDFVTIAYSVEGGYTPLKWKYLGDEVAARLKLPQQMDAPEPYDKMREALIAQNHGDLATAQRNFRSVGDKLGSPPHFALAHLLANAGRTEEARRFYERALALNPSYRNAWANAGLVFYGNGRYEAAEDACRRTLLLDPTDPYSHLGLGWIAARRKRWEQAVSEFSASLALQPDLIDAQRGIAHALEKGGQLEKAIRAYEKSIKLALEGRKPLGFEIITRFYVL